MLSQSTENQPQKTSQPAQISLTEEAQFFAAIERGEIQLTPNDLVLAELTEALGLK